MKPSEILRMVLAIALISGIGLFLIVALAPYLGAIIGAVIFFFLFAPLQHRLVDKRNLSPALSAAIIIVIMIFAVVVPLTFMVNTLFTEMTRIAQNPEVLESFVVRTVEVGQRFGFEMTVDRWVDELVIQLRGLLASAIRQVSQSVISFTILLFVFYYLLINASIVHKQFIRILPFNAKHSELLYDEFRRVTNATLLSTGVIALLQGVILTILFLLIGVPGAFFWGALGAVFSFLPVVGVTLIYLIIGAGYLLMGSIGAGITLIVAGLFFGNADNFIRGPLTRRFGKLHPLVTIIGIFIGVPTFGLVGIVAGPLLLSYFLLMLQMFKEEYVPENE